MRDTSELVYKNFQAIEEAINKKEEEMLMCLEKCAADLDSTRRLIGNARDLACEIPAILEDGKTLLEKEEKKKEKEEEKEVDDEKSILNIKKKAKQSEDIIMELALLEKCDVYANTEGFLNGVKRRLEDIGGIKELPMKRVLRSAPTGLTADKTSSVYVILR